jgi:hypothetical protein
MAFAVPSGFDVGLMYRGLTSMRWDAPWARGDLGGADAFLDHMQYFGYVLPALCVLLAQKITWRHPMVWVSGTLAAIMVLFIAQGGGRRVVGVAVGSALYTWLVSQKVLRPKLVIWTGVVIFALLSFMQLMLIYRGVGFGAYLAGEQSQEHFEDFHIDDNFLRLTQIISFFPDRVDYAYWGPIYHAICLPIPRLFWPGKPLSPGYSLPDLLDRPGASLSSSIVGELYASLGLLAVCAGGLVLGRLAGMWNKCLQLPPTNGRALIFSVGLMAMFAGLRSMQALVQMSYIVLAWIVIARLVAANSRNSKHGLEIPT